MSETPAGAATAEAGEGRPVRILAVGNMYPPHHAGGYEIAWQAAMRRARDDGHAVRILASDYREAGDRDEEDPDVHRSLQWYWDLAGYRFVHQSRRAALRLERGNRDVLARHLAEFRPDVVAWWSMGCMSLSLVEQARRAGVPAIFLVHDDWLVYGFERDAWMHAWRGRRRVLAPLAERLCGVPARVEVAAAGPLVFNSRYTRARAGTAGVDVTGATVIHPGIDERFLDAPPPAEWGWRIAYVGRIDRQKGVDIAVSALAHLPPEATLTVWGSGQEEYVTEMRGLAARLGVGDRLRFAGFAAADGLRDAYAAADAVVFPVRWQEPFGLVPLEAMGMGRPVIATAHGGTAEFVADGENALVITADDPAALAAQITRLAGDEPLRLRLRERGRRTAAAHTAGRFAEETVAAIVAAARAGSGAAPAGTA